MACNQQLFPIAGTNLKIDTQSKRLISNRNVTDASDVRNILPPRVVLKRITN